MTKAVRREILFGRRMLRPVARTVTLASLGTLALGAALPAQALNINPVFDSSITSLSNASTIESAFDQVAADYAKSFSNSATVNIDVSWGKVDGMSLPSSAVGASVDPLYGYFTYSQVRAFLTNSARSNPSDRALATSVSNLPATSPSGMSRFVIPSAEMKALGLISGSSSSFDGYIGFAGSASSYSFNPSAGIKAGTYDFEAVAAHEIDEVLGRISGLESSSPSFATPFDLDRFSAQGTRSFSYNAQAYFSINGGATDLGNFNNSPYGGDRSDWLTLAGSTDVQDAFVSTGQSLNITAADLTGLDVIGWGGTNAGDNGSPPTTVAFHLIEDVPEPASLALILSGLGVLGFVRCRSRA
jgi:hypothetical protein